MYLKRPMLAEEANLSLLKFPLLASPKIDGIRMLCKSGLTCTRSMKEIPNRFLRQVFSDPFFHGMDGELTLGSPSDKDVFLRTSSAVRRFEGQPIMTYSVFDMWNLPYGYTVRYKAAADKISDWSNHNPSLNLVLLRQTAIHSLSELEAYEEDILSQGYEGVMLRSPNSPYKQNRSTALEGYLLKLKRFSDSEGQLISVEEMLSNFNPPELDERGFTKRSSHSANLVGAATMGTIVLRLASGHITRIGSGFTAAQRAWFWQKRVALAKLQPWVVFKHLPHGALNLPRHGIYKGFRPGFDMEKVSDSGTVTEP